MKRFIVIGLGNFGSILATRLYEVGNDVVAIDTRAEIVDSIGHKVSRALVGDGTRSDVLEEAGARAANAAIVSTGDNLSASMLALIALRDLRVPDILVKVRSREHERIAEALGAADTIFPERESAMALASRMTSGRLLQYVRLGTGFGLQEMPVPEPWIGKTLRELSLPQQFRVQVVAIHDVLQDVMISAPGADRKLLPSDTLLVAGDVTALEKLSAQ